MSNSFNAPLNPPLPPSSCTPPQLQLRNRRRYYTNGMKHLSNRACFSWSLQCVNPCWSLSLFTIPSPWQTGNAPKPWDYPPFTTDSLSQAQALQNLPSVYSLGWRVLGSCPRDNHRYFKRSGQLQAHHIFIEKQKNILQCQLVTKRKCNKSLGWGCDLIQMQFWSPPCALHQLGTRCYFCYSYENYCGCFY